MPRISVIIVNYNVKEFLNNSIESILKALKNFESEIIVVDNNSTDGSVEFIKNKFPFVKLIENKNNLGFGKANNQALKIASGEFIVLINPDTIVSEETFSSLINFFKTKENAGMVSCKVLNVDGTLQLACRRSFPTPWISFTKIFGLSAIFPKSKIFAKYNLTFLDENQIAEVDAISGSFMMMRKTVYDAVGGFDEIFFMYGEDLDLCYRINNSGWKIYYVPTTSIIHFKGESTKRSGIDEMKIFYSAMNIYFKKHFKSTWMFEKIINSAIYLRHLLSSVSKVSKILFGAIIDSSLLIMFLFLAEYMRRGKIWTYPEYAYPMVYVAPILILVSILFLMKVYSQHKLSASRTFTGTIIYFLIISTSVAFIKEFAFSRYIMLLSGGLTILFLPGWRLLLKIIYKNKIKKYSIFKSNTLVIGTNESAEKIINYISKNQNDGFEIVGILSDDVRRIGEKFCNAKIIGTFEMLEKTIENMSISEVIVAKDTISLNSLLDTRANNNFKNVNFRLTFSGEDFIFNSKFSLDNEFPPAPFILRKKNIVDKIFFN